MLILSRKVGERILIGDSIAVVVTRIRPNVVQIGIQAPNGTNIIREELRDSITLEELEAELVGDFAEVVQPAA